jgi:hypothetical protein
MPLHSMSRLCHVRSFRSVRFWVSLQLLLTLLHPFLLLNALPRDSLVMVKSVFAFSMNQSLLAEEKTSNRSDRERLDEQLRRMNAQMRGMTLEVNQIREMNSPGEGIENKGEIDKDREDMEEQKIGVAAKDMEEEKIRMEVSEKVDNHMCDICWSPWQHLSEAHLKNQELSNEDLSRLEFPDERNSNVGVSDERNVGVPDEHNNRNIDNNNVDMRSMHANNIANNIAMRSLNYNIPGQDQRQNTQSQHTQSQNTQSPPHENPKVMNPKIMRLACGHVFHAECLLLGWKGAMATRNQNVHNGQSLRPKCPKCKARVL